MVEAFYEGYRGRVLASLDGLDDEAAGRRALRATDLTVAGVVVHLARVEDLWFSEKFLGQPPREPWASAPYHDDRDWDFHAGATFGLDRARQLYTDACARSRLAAATAADLDTSAQVSSFGVGPVTLRWIYLHMLEETACHAGHLDLLRDELTR